MGDFKVDSEQLARKILNELKYNKKMLPLWKNLTAVTDEKESFFKYLSHRIEILDTNPSLWQKISVNSTKENLFKKISKEEAEIEKLEKIINSKKNNNAMNQLNIISFDKEIQINPEEIKYNQFINLELDMFLLSVLWFEKIGHLLDKELSASVYANRVSEKSNTFFGLYFEAYNEYRDNAFEEMNHLVDQGKTGFTIQLDFKECFYHIDVDFLFKEVEATLKEKADKIELENLYMLNNKIFDVIRAYNTEKTNRQLLPIGFLPSNILINFYLSKLDQMLIRELNPISYGRYVDDITIVLKREFKNELLKKEIYELDARIEGIKETFISKEGINVPLTFHPDKKVYFVINKKSDRHYIKKFENSTKRLSSDFHRLMDVNQLEYEIDAAYEIVDNPVKLEELFKIQKDKKSIAKVISSVFYSLYSEPIKDEKRNKELATKFMLKFDSVIDTETFYELADYWLAVILIEYVALGYEYKKMLSDKKFQQLSIVTRLNKYLMLLEKSQADNSEKLINLIENYMDLFKALFSSLQSNKYLQDVLNNFIVPKFLNDMYQTENKRVGNKYSTIYLNFENQLAYLHDYFEKPKNGGIESTEESKGAKKFESIEDIDKMIKGFNELQTEAVKESQVNRSDCDISVVDNPPRTIFDFSLDGPLSKQIRVSQVNQHSPIERNTKFQRYGRNSDKSTETTNAMNMAAEQKSDILVFPEHGFNITDISKIVKFVRKNQIPIVGGLDYIMCGKYVLNLTIVFVPFRTYTKPNEFYLDCAIIIQPKRFPAPGEYEIFSNSNSELNQSRNREMYIPLENKYQGITFNYQGIQHSVLNCYEATDLKIKADLSLIKPDLVHIITNNKDINYYDSIGEVISRELMCVTTVTNYSIYGGTQIFIPFKERYKQLVSYHKGSEILHVFSSKVDIDSLRQKRSNNLFDVYRQNPPRIYYSNVKD